MGRRSRRLLAALVLAAGGLAMAAIGLVRAGPRPRVRLVRAVMDLGGDAAARALAAHVPPGVVERLDLSYDPSDPDARFDVFHPAGVDGTPQGLPTIVWVHGGAWVSGRKDHVANYLRILAASGFTTVGVEYTTAPEATYPTPILQLGRALAHVHASAAELHVDPTRIVLAGDSAGAQLAAQVANLLTSPAYAERAGIHLPPTPAPDGVILHCGAFDLQGFDPRSPLRRFVRDVLRSYGGSPDPSADGALAAASIAPHATSAFPPAFISVGDADPLAPQSVELADRLESLGVPVERCFFAGDDAAGLGHEYQFDLDTPAGRLALDRSVAFARRVTGGA
jgi:acetyl esterase/lipase